MVRRLVKVAKELGIKTTALVEILNSNGFHIENKPTAKVSDEAFKILLSQLNKPSATHKRSISVDKSKDEYDDYGIEGQQNISVGDFCDANKLTIGEFLALAAQQEIKHRYSFQSILSKDIVSKLTAEISQIQSSGEKIEKLYPLGTIIESEILESVYPQGAKVRFDLDYSGFIAIQNFASSIIHAEQNFDLLNSGKPITCVVYQYDHFNKVCHLSTRHLSDPKPATLQRGDVIRGKPIEQLESRSIILLENGELGISKLVHENSLFNVLSYNELSGLYSLQEHDEQEEEIRHDRGNFKFETHSFVEPELTNYLNFAKSSFGVTATLEEKMFLREQFERNINLFARELRLKTHILLKFLNDRSWDELKKEAGEGNTKEALALLSKGDYWVRYQSNENNQSEELILFNESTFIKTTISVIDDEIIFIVDSFSIGRKDKWASFTKKRAANSGALLNQSKILFLNPYDNIPLDSEQEEVVEAIRNKFKAFDILKSLKERTGVILQTEGEALKIFENFLEYQISVEKAKEREPTKILSFKKFPSSSGLNRYAIQTSEKLPDIVESVEIGETIYTRKEKSEEAFVQFASGKLVKEFGEFFLEVIDSVDLAALNKDIYLRESINVFHLDSQKEIIQDFFNKKINITHIEKLLVDRNSIKPPKNVNVTFKNPDLAATFLNEPQNKQIEAVRKAVGNRNILLIQGPPGTGKTTVIAEIVQQLTDKGEKILISSQGHVAVDNVLEKLVDTKKLLITRIGSEDKIDPSLVRFQEQNSIEAFSKWYSLFIDNQLNLIIDVLNENSVGDRIAEYSAHYPDYLKDRLRNYHHLFCKKLHTYDKDDIEILRTNLEVWRDSVSIQKEILITPLFYKNIDIVFGTCLGLKNNRFLKQNDIKFDTLILDEAGKANMAETFVAISLAKKIILVGDQKQLPPYLDSSLIDPDDDGSFPNSIHAQKTKFDKIRRALSTSFFEFLVQKVHKGEFPKENLIMLDVQHRMHPNIGNLVSESFYGSKIRSAPHTVNNRITLPAPFDKEIVFVDTSNDSNPYEKKINETSYINELEAAYITKEIIPALLEGGIDKDNFAVISPYKYQVNHIKERLAKDPTSQDVNVETLDSFQGKEFDIIVLSFTRSSKSGRVGFLDDARRLNVALSRAKKKLILVGNAKTLCSPKSHFDQIFNYTALFEKIVSIASNDKTGTFFQITNQFSHIPIKVASSYPFAVGDIVNGRVKKLENYGAFIDLGARISGLCYIRDLTYGRINDPSEVLSEGDEIRVKILGIDEGRISLGIKQLSPDPWDEFNKKHEVGQAIQGRVVAIEDYGAFIEIIPGVEGLIHHSEISWKKKNVITQSFFTIGEVVKAMLKSIDYSNRTLALSIKELSSDPWKNVEERFPSQTVHTGVITVVMSYGIFVELDPGFTGLLHASKLPKNTSIQSFKVGQSLYVRILNCDPINRRIFLGLAQSQKSNHNQRSNSQTNNITINGVKITAGQLFAGQYHSKIDDFFVISLFEGAVGYLEITKDTIRRIKITEQLPMGFQFIKVKVYDIEQNERIILALG